MHTKILFHFCLVFTSLNNPYNINIAHESSSNEDNKKPKTRNIISAFSSDKLLHHHEETANFIEKKIVREFEIISFTVQMKQMNVATNYVISEYFDYILKFTKDYSKIHPQFNQNTDIYSLKDMRSHLNNSKYDAFKGLSEKEVKCNNDIYKHKNEEFTNIIQQIFDKTKKYIYMIKKDARISKNLLLKYLIESVENIIELHMMLIFPKPLIFFDSLIESQRELFKINKINLFYIADYNFAQNHIRNVIFKIENELKYGMSSKKATLLEYRIFLLRQLLIYPGQYISLMMAIGFKDFLLELEILYIFIEQHNIVKDQDYIKNILIQLNNIVYAHPNQIMEKSYNRADIFIKKYINIHLIASEMQFLFKKHRFCILKEHKKILFYIKDGLNVFMNNISRKMLLLHSGFFDELNGLLSKEILNIEKGLLREKLIVLRSISFKIYFFMTGLKNLISNFSENDKIDDKGVFEDSPTLIRKTSDIYNSPANSLLDINNDESIDLFQQPLKTTNTYIRDNVIFKNQTFPHNNQVFLIDADRSLIKTRKFLKNIGNIFEEHNMSAKYTPTFFKQLFSLSKIKKDKYISKPNYKLNNEIDTKKTGIPANSLPKKIDTFINESEICIEKKSTYNHSIVLENFKIFRDNLLLPLNFCDGRNKSLAKIRLYYGVFIVPLLKILSQYQLKNENLIFLTNYERIFDGYEFISRLRKYKMSSSLKDLEEFILFNEPLYPQVKFKELRDINIDTTNMLRIDSRMFSRTTNFQRSIKESSGVYTPQDVIKIEVKIRKPVRWFTVFNDFNHYSHNTSFRTYHTEILSQTSKICGFLEEVDNNNMDQTQGNALIRSISNLLLLCDIYYMKSCSKFINNEIVKCTEIFSNLHKYFPVMKIKEEHSEISKRDNKIVPTILYELMCMYYCVMDFQGFIMYKQYERIKVFNEIFHD